MNEYTIIQNALIYTPTQTLEKGTIIFNQNGIIEVCPCRCRDGACPTSANLTTQDLTGTGPGDRKGRDGVNPSSTQQRVNTPRTSKSRSVEEGLVPSRPPGPPPQACLDIYTPNKVIDATDAIITPGFIEVHTHGGGSFALHTTNPEEIHSYAHWAASTGVTSFLIAIIGTPASLPISQLQTAVEAIEHYRVTSASSLGAEPLGIFLEGPYINIKQRGAHSPAWLRTPAETETAHILELAKGHLKLVTLAPELPSAEQMIRHLTDAGVTVSLGHSDADYKQTQAAIQQGITHVTHCFNAMRPLLHREPGPLGAIAQAEHIFGELIADGIHVHPAVIDILVRILGPDRIIAITDAQSCAGLTESESFEFAGQPARIIDGAARLSDGTLAGSILTMTQALQNLLTYTHVTPSQAISMLTSNPARSIKVANRKGTLQPGHDADLLIFDRTFQLQATICRGKVAFATEAWKARLNAIYTNLPPLPL